MPSDSRVAVKLFGALHSLQKERGRPTTMDIDVPAEGESARDVALRLELPVDRIEGVFCNHVIRPLSHTVNPGDKIAFVPEGTPGPHRFFLGLYDAGKEG